MTVDLSTLVLVPAIVARRSDEAHFRLEQLARLYRSMGLLVRTRVTTAPTPAGRGGSRLGVAQEAGGGGAPPRHPPPAPPRRPACLLPPPTEIYTRTGDGGETGLADGSRISKDHPRAQAVGDVDEANCAIGVALLHIVDEGARGMLGAIQNEMFDLGADLATPGEDFAPSEMSLRIVQSQIDRLEREIDCVNADLEPLRSFILPGGGGGSAGLHLARAVVRRAERSAVAAAREVSLNPLALIYLNRLSDHLFVMARYLARKEGGDVLWQPGATRGE